MRHIHLYAGACVERGLLSTDREWERILAEAIASESPSAIRQLLATIVVYCEPTNYNDLFAQFWDGMADDFRARFDDQVDPVLRALVSYSAIGVSASKISNLNVRVIHYVQPHQCIVARSTSTCCSSILFPASCGIQSNAADCNIKEATGKVDGSFIHRPGIAGVVSM